MPAVHTSNPDLRSIVGEVTGFMLEWQGQKSGAFYISGDTVWSDEIKRSQSDTRSTLRSCTSAQRTCPPLVTTTSP